MNHHSWTVSQLTAYIQQVLELDAVLQDVWLTGEVSNVTRSTPGHLYFTLKDAAAAVQCVMWRSAAVRLSWRPEPGAAALVHGRIGVYAPRGAYQLAVDQMWPAGQGDLHARFEQVRDALKAEGLFDAERKKPLPPFPQGLGVVTSPQAAALQDVLRIVGRRYPLARVVLAPTAVQGEQAPLQIVEALQALDARDDVDVLLLVRGGGSLEELWAFNDERVARAIAACRHPVVSGVGHETDFTIADFAADMRASTPSAAAELTTPDRAELKETLLAWLRRMQGSLERRLATERQAVERQERAVQRWSPQAWVDRGRQQVDELALRCGRSLGHSLALRRSRLEGLQARLAALSPQGTLERGYAIVRRSRAEGRAVVSRVGQVRAGDELAIQVRDGELGAVVLPPPGGG